MFYSHIHMGFKEQFNLELGLRAIWISIIIFRLTTANNWIPVFWQYRTYGLVVHICEHGLEGPLQLESMLEIMLNLSFPAQLNSLTFIFQLEKLWMFKDWIELRNWSDVGDKKSDHQFRSPTSTLPFLLRKLVNTNSGIWSPVGSFEVNPCQIMFGVCFSRKHSDQINFILSPRSNSPDQPSINQILIGFKNVPLIL